MRKAHCGTPSCDEGDEQAVPGFAKEREGTMAACGGVDPVLPKTVELAKGLLRQRNLLLLACLELLLGLY